METIAQILGDDNKDALMNLTQHTMTVLDQNGDGKINIEEFVNGFAKTKLFNVDKRRNSKLAEQLKQEPEDFFLSSIKKKGFCSGFDANRMRARKSRMQMTTD